MAENLSAKQVAGVVLSAAAVFGVLVWTGIIGDSSPPKPSAAQERERERQVQQDREEAAQLRVRREAKLQAATKQIGEAWSTFDTLPADQRTKAALLPAFEMATALANAAGEAAPEAREVANAGFRKRAGRLIVYGTSTRGQADEVLVPPGDAAHCVGLGTMWAKSSGGELKSMGFRQIACGDPSHRTWDL